MSALKLVTPPAIAPVSLEEAKKHLRVDHDDDDDLIEALISAATDYAEKFQGRALIDQVWDLYLDVFPVCAIEIPKPPLIEIVGVFYRDSNGDEQEFEAFEVDLASEPARVYLPVGGSWPTAADQLNAVRVRFRAGYLDGSSPPVQNVPATTTAAIKLVLGTLYEHRETVVVGAAVTVVPWSAEQLLRQRRIDLSLA